MSTPIKDDTLTFIKPEPVNCKQVLKQVYDSLKEKGYNPVGQIVGYLTSDDPTYITNSNGARSLITKVSRYALMQELVENYISGLEDID